VHQFAEDLSSGKVLNQHDVEQVEVALIDIVALIVLVEDVDPAQHRIDDDVIVGWVEYVIDGVRRDRRRDLSEL
jgi:hypothetical protein